MKQVTSTEANRSFSKLLARAAKGEPTEITVRGKVVARLQPVSEVEKQREAAFQELLERLRSQSPMGIPRGTRDELYDD
jgi:prevent-host-death family protein